LYIVNYCYCWLVLCAIVVDYLFCWLLIVCVLQLLLLLLLLRTDGTPVGPTPVAILLPFVILFPFGCTFICSQFDLFRLVGYGCWLFCWLILLVDCCCCTHWLLLFVVVPRLRWVVMIAVRFCCWFCWYLSTFVAVITIVDCRYVVGVYVELLRLVLRLFCSPPVVIVTAVGVSCYVTFIIPICCYFLLLPYHVC